MTFQLTKDLELSAVLPTFFSTKKMVQIVSEPGMGKTKVLINEIKNLITSEVKQNLG